MRKIIDGHRYDTETATEIGEWSYGSSGDFDHVSETLYRTKAGLYFIFGEGGARTQYAEQVEQNAWQGGEKIVALSLEAARKWAEEKLDADDYESEWGTPDEDEGRAMTIRVPESVYRIIRDASATQGCSMGKIVTNAILSGNL